MQRHVEGDAVVVRSGLEPIMQCESRVAERKIFREAFGFAAFARQ